MTADDVRAVVSVAYLSSTPDFPAFNLALDGALKGNWSNLSYDAYGSVYTAAFFPVLQTVCLDRGKPFSAPTVSSAYFTPMHQTSIITPLLALTASDRLL